MRDHARQIVDPIRYAGDRSDAACRISTRSPRRARRVFEPLHDAPPLLLNLGQPGDLTSLHGPTRRLERMGVEIHLETMVAGVDARGIDTTAEDPQLRRIETATKIWAAGVEGSPLGRLVADQAGAGVDRAGRVHVRPDCTLPGYPEVFVVGDVMSLDDLPAIGRVAVDSARHAATRSCAAWTATPRTTVPLVARLALDEQQPVMRGDAATLAPGRS
jgi:NADH dehydrogenase FAD-containing subunit